MSITGTAQSTLTLTVTGATANTVAQSSIVNADFQTILNAIATVAGGYVAWTTVTSSGTSSVSTSERLQNSSVIVRTLPGSPTAGQQVRYRHEGTASVYLSTTAKINGISQRDAVIVPGADFVITYVSSTLGWVAPSDALKVLPSSLDGCTLVEAYNADRSLTSSGGNVTQWNDLSANSLHLTVATNAPAESTDINGHRSVTFDDSNTEGLSHADSALLNVTAYTFVALIKPDAQPGLATIWSHGDNPGNSEGIVVQQDTAGAATTLNITEAGVGATGGAGGLPANVISLIRVVRTAETSGSAGNGTLRASINGMQTAIYGTRGVLVDSSEPIYVGRSSAAVGGYFSGAIGGAAFCDGASPRMAQMIGEYLATGYGLFGLI